MITETLSSIKMANMSQVAGLTDALTRLETMISALDTKLAGVEAKTDNIGNSVDATNLALKSNIDNLGDLNRSTEELRKTTAAEIGASGRIAAIEQKLSDSYDTLVDGVRKLDKELRDKLTSVDKMSALNADKMNAYENQFRVHQASIEQVQQDVIAKTSRLEGAISGAYAQVHSQAQGQQSNIAGNSRNTLDSEKKFDVMAKITGDEPVSDILEWKRKIGILIETTIPGALGIFEWAEKQIAEITAEVIAFDHDYPVTHKLNQQLYSFMMLKMGGRADVIMRKIDPRMGLEAWRSVWKVIGRKDEQSMHEEFIKLTNVPMQKKLSTLTGFITRWEVRLDELFVIDPTNYIVGPMHRLTILKNMLPSDLSAWVSNEQTYGRLMTFIDLKAFVIQKSNHAYNREAGGAPEISVNYVTGASESSPPPPWPAIQGAQNFTDAECQEWVMEAEGAQYHHDHPEDDQMNRAVLSLVAKGKGGKIGGKGKGKGGGKSYKGVGKGKGKGGKGKSGTTGKGFQGDCYNCG